MENRLLSEQEQFRARIDAIAKCDKPTDEVIFKCQLEAQDAKTTAARDKWWMEGVEPIINSLVEHISHGDYSNGNTAQGSDEGEYLSAHHVEYLLDKWQSLKQSLEAK